MSWLCRAVIDRGRRWRSVSPLTSQNVPQITHFRRNAPHSLLSDIKLLQRQQNQSTNHPPRIVLLTLIMFNKFTLLLCTLGLAIASASAAPPHAASVSTYLFLHSFFWLVRYAEWCTCLHRNEGVPQYRQPRTLLGRRDYDCCLDWKSQLERNCFGLSSAW